MDFDIIGLLFLLWAVFSGVTGSQKAKKAKEEKERRDKLKGIPSQQMNKPVIEKQQRQEKGFNPFEKLSETLGDVLKEIEKSVIEPGEPAPRTPVKTKYKPVNVEKELPSRQKAMQIEKQTKLEKKISQEQYTKEGIYQQKNTPIDAIQKGEQGWKNATPDFEIDSKKVLTGIIWSEILQPPRAKNKLRNNLMRR
ncbi:hypothetical protein SAMN00017405_1389 [Desulfonispora thiosulfatigenes DSM 11270]|uniref:Uncharacterized protein n=1 Tax=Desulfonispora thiosulfatigenes DSM 11270 TaxID=656914 RepID=A0A1W1VC70_DESTI|nr:hypothetical protein [Desulfonispora thiosulfatigenes]SMB90952.1 hypothetical protein SAMN00017405_1389 [Desulfonispora thiosulfatigenes DSM 11270]